MVTAIQYFNILFEVAFRKLPSKDFSCFILVRANQVKLTKNSASRAFQQTPIKHRIVGTANVGLQYCQTGYVS